LAALISVELLACTSLFGAYFYGGVSSPFLPWLLISLLLGFFYLSERPILVVGLFTFNILALLWQNVGLAVLYKIPESSFQ